MARKTNMAVCILWFYDTTLSPEAVACRGAICIGRASGTPLAEIKFHKIHKYLKCQSS